MSGVDLPGALTDLSDQEKNLVDAARRGTRLTCSKLGHEELGRSTAPEHLIRAEVIRELLLGLHGDLDPRGIWLSGARITGDLDVQFIDAPVVLALLRCVFDRPAWFIGAHFKWIDLDGTRMPTFQADALRVDGSLMMRAGFTATGDSISGAVNLWGASIGRSLELDGATLTNNSGPAISAQGLSVGGPMFLRRGFPPLAETITA